MIEEKQRLELIRAGSIRIPMTDSVTSPAAGQRISKFLILAIVSLSMYGSAKIIDALPEMPEAAEIFLRIGAGALIGGVYMHGLLNLADMRRVMLNEKIRLIEEEPITALTIKDEKLVKTFSVILQRQ